MQSISMIHTLRRSHLQRFLSVEQATGNPVESSLPPKTTYSPSQILTTTHVIDSPHFGVSQTLAESRHHHSLRDVTRHRKGGNHVFIPKAEIPELLTNVNFAHVTIVVELEGEFCTSRSET